MGIRKSDFAGSWYPSVRSECIKAMDVFSKDCIPCPSIERATLGGIVPHAGWYYSGQIAFNVIKCLDYETPADVFIIFGRHLHPGSGNFIMKEGSWDTPLGELEVDSDFTEKLISEFKFTLETSSKYEQDNTIELQLPFIKYLFPDVKIVPIGVPPVTDSIKIGIRVAEIAEEMGKKISVLGSTDLTHYGYNYGYTPKGIGHDAVEWVKKESDRKIINLMLEMDEKGVIAEASSNFNSCCSGAVAAAIACVKRMGASNSEELIYKTSNDILPNDSFVGYVGIIFYM